MADKTICESGAIRVNRAQAEYNALHREKPDLPGYYYNGTGPYWSQTGALKQDKTDLRK